MKKSLIILAIVTTILSCSKQDESNIKNADYIESVLEFSVINSQSEDLLDPENPNHLNIDNIKIFYMIDGVRQEVFNPNMDYPRNFFVFENENEYRIRVFLNTTDTSDKAVTYIHWNESDTDTVEVAFNRNHSSIYQNKIWLNGVQVWEIGNNTIDPYFKLTK